MNILLIMADQLRRNFLGFAGDQIVKTPNIDKLADRSTDFTRHYTCAPTCAPNRASLFTARMPSAHGLRTNGMSLVWDTPTITAALAENGYTTHLVGKSHMQPYGIGQGNKEVAVGTGNYFPDHGPRGEDYTRESVTRNKQERIEFREAYYGWDHVDLTLQHGDTVQGHYYWWLKERGIDWEEVTGPQNALARSESWPDVVYQPAIAEEHYPTRYIEEKTIEALETYAENGEPFFLVSSIPDPHHPFTPPGKYWGRYDPKSLPLPRTFEDPLTAAPPHLRAIKANRGTQKDVYLGYAPTEEQFRDALAAQYGQIEMIDDAVGAILEKLEDLGIADNTAVIFVSDHGDMFGDHGLMFKHCMHYDAMIRIPLLVAVPGQDATVNEGFAMTMDVGATILDIAGIQPIYGQQGISVRGGLGNPAHTIRDSAYVEEELPFGTDGLKAPVRMRTTVTDEGRLTLYADEEFGELYDLKADPDEMNNLWGKPEGEKLQAGLMKRMAENAMAVDLSAMVPRYVG